jgi:hypothetical protein
MPVNGKATHRGGLVLRAATAGGRIRYYHVNEAPIIGPLNVMSAIAESESRS